jgi:8-oxo-dGTP diphosphatase
VPAVPPITPDDSPEEGRRQRVAAYAVVLRGPDVLLSRLAPYLVPDEQWTLPGGGIDFGEDPRDAVVREVYEETGLDVTVGDRAWIDSGGRGDYHAIRIVFEAWAPKDAPEPRVVEVDGSTVDARWVPLADVLDGSHPVVGWVRAALEEHAVTQVQRLAAKAVIRRGAEILERPAVALAREVFEETGLEATVGDLLGVHDVHFTGTAPDGRHEDFHAVNLIFSASVPDSLAPRVVEEDGTTDDVSWVSLAAVEAGRVPVTDVVRFAVGLTSAP